MDYYEFVCAGAAALYVVTADRDSAKMPGGAQACCQEWTFSRAFKLGDGSHDAALDVAIQSGVAAGRVLHFPQPPSQVTAAAALGRDASGWDEMA
jgi:hypothetical protein